MRPREFKLPIERCPLCGATGTFHIKGRIDDIPYFGEVMETLLTCSGCNYRHADVMCIGERIPMRYEFHISTKDDLTVRVVKSSTGTIKVPELDVTVEPGPASEGYVSNIEGVLNRIEAAVKLAIKKADARQRRRGKAVMKKLHSIRAGKLKARMIVMDPFGHSAIVDERVKKRRLKKRELASLKTGPLRLYAGVSAT
jgi:zinc finger protein